VQAAHAEAGKTEVKGPSLDSEVLQDLARAVGATGNDASAVVVPRKGRRSEKKSLKGSNVVIKRDSIETIEDQRELVVEVRVRLEQVRRGNDKQ
jgi:hypothetical protein